MAHSNGAPQGCQRNVGGATRWSGWWSSTKLRSPSSPSVGDASAGSRSSDTHAARATRIRRDLAPVVRMVAMVEPAVPAHHRCTRYTRHAARQGEPARSATRRTNNRGRQGSRDEPLRFGLAATVAGEARRRRRDGDSSDDLRGREDDLRRRQPHHGAADWLASYADPASGAHSRRSTSAAPGSWPPMRSREAEAAPGRRGRGRRARRRAADEEGLGRPGRLRPRGAQSGRSTCSASTASSCSRRSRRRSSPSDDPDVIDGGTRAHNRAMVDFCRPTPARRGRRRCSGRLRSAASSRGRRGARPRLRRGARSLPSGPRRVADPSRLRPVWSTLEERDVPFMLHIGGGGRALKKAFHDNGRPDVRLPRWRRERAGQGLHGDPPGARAVPVGDGARRRARTAHRSLRGGCIEQGAMWVVPVAAAARHLPGHLQEDRADAERHCPMRASDYVHRQLWFTPFPARAGRLDDRAVRRRPVPVLVRLPASRGDEEPDRAVRVERWRTSTSAQRDRFYFGNYAEMMGAAV